MTAWLFIDHPHLNPAKFIIKWKSAHWKLFTTRSVRCDKLVNIKASTGVVPRANLVCPGGRYDWFHFCVLKPCLLVKVERTSTQTKYSPHLQAYPANQSPGLMNISDSLSETIVFLIHVNSTNMYVWVCPCLGKPFVGCLTKVALCRHHCDWRRPNEHLEC